MSRRRRRTGRKPGRKADRQRSSGRAHHEAPAIAEQRSVVFGRGPRGLRRLAGERSSRVEVGGRRPFLLQRLGRWLLFERARDVDQKRFEVPQQPPEAAPRPASHAPPAEPLPRQAEYAGGGRGKPAPTVPLEPFDLSTGRLPQQPSETARIDDGSIDGGVAVLQGHDEAPWRPPSAEPSTVGPAALGAASGAAVYQAPPEVAPPAGIGRWCIEPSAGDGRHYGSFSHAGPREVAVDKGNQDFAFHLELPRGDARWVLCGVADGVGQGTWSARAARHAVAGFVEGIDEALGDSAFPHTAEQLLGSAWPVVVARHVHRHISDRLHRDARLLREGGFIDPTWSASVYQQQFLAGRYSDTRIRSRWLQTTLLATAIGPHGGLALFLGDGFARVDRRMPDGRWLSSPGLDPTPAVSLDLQEQQVFGGLIRLAQREGTRIAVLLATDGVSDSKDAALVAATDGCALLPGYEQRPPLERVQLLSSGECERVLSRLATQPASLAARDNMSMAFASCPLDGGA